MSVFTRTKQWNKGEAIPYLISQDVGMQEEDVKNWINFFNQELTYALLIQKEGEQSDNKPYILFHYKNCQAGHSVIGKPDHGNRKVEFDNKETFYHELLHALGFNHEQYHKKYPWDRNDPSVDFANDKKKRLTTYEFKEKSKNIKNQTMYATLLKNYGIPMQVDGQLRQLYLVADSQDWLFSENIDAESIMMYESSATGIVEGFKKSSTPSKEDFATIRLYYPDPQISHS